MKSLALFCLILAMIFVVTNAQAEPFGASADSNCTITVSGSWSSVQWYESDGCYSGVGDPETSDWDSQAQSDTPVNLSTNISDSKGAASSNITVVAGPPPTININSAADVNGLLYEGGHWAMGYSEGGSNWLTSAATQTVTVTVNYSYKLDLTAAKLNDCNAYAKIYVAFWDPDSELMLAADSEFVQQGNYLVKHVEISTLTDTGVVTGSKAWDVNVTSGTYYSFWGQCDAMAYTGSPTVKWVSQADGNDLNDGNTEATAYKTLQHGINSSKSGVATTRSIINVKNGTYGTTGLTNNQDGGWDTAILIKDLDYLTIQAVSGQNPVVAPVTAETNNVVSISIENCDHLIIDNIDSNQTIKQFDNWHVADSHDLTVRNCTFEGGEDGIDFNTDMTAALIENNAFRNINTGSGDEVLDFTDDSYSDVTIQDNIFENNYRQITLNEASGKTISSFIIRRNIMDGTTSEEAIRLIEASDILLENNVLMNSLQQGLYIDNGCSNVTVQHNTFFNNGYEQLLTKITSSDISIKNNIFNSNGTYAALASSASPLPGENYNLIYNAGSSTQYPSYPAVTSYGPNTITGQDPLFVSMVSGSEDLSLQDTSPALGMGTDLGVTEDIDQTTRPQPSWTNPDLGAYESIMVCFDPNHPDYDDWVSVGKPRCWCNKYQCCGDDNGEKNGDPISGYYYVEYKDLSLVLSSWKAVETATNFNICADMNRAENGDPISGYYRVEYKDLSLVFSYWKLPDSQMESQCPFCGGSYEP